MFFDEFTGSLDPTPRAVRGDGLFRRCISLASYTDNFMSRVKFKKEKNNRKSLTEFAEKKAAHSHYNL